MLDIKGYEGLYAITSCGKVWSHRRKIFLKPLITKKGYCTVELSRGRVYRIHRLVAQAYLSNPDNLPEVNHKDEDKSNNSVSNLEWCTSEYNLTYGTCRQRAKESIKTKYGKSVYCVELDKTFSSAGEASAELHIKDDRIRYCCKGRRKTAGGYHWKYV